MFKRLGMIALTLLLFAGGAFAAGNGTGGTLYNTPRTTLGAFAGADYIGYYSTHIVINAGGPLANTTGLFTIGAGTTTSVWIPSPYSGAAILMAIKLPPATATLAGNTTDYVVFYDTWQSIQNSTVVNGAYPEYFRVNNAYQLTSSTMIVTAGAITVAPSAGTWIPVGLPGAGGIRFDNGITYSLGAGVGAAEYSYIELLYQLIH